MTLCFPLGHCFRRTCISLNKFLNFSNFRKYTTTWNLFNRPHEDTPTEWKSVAEEVQAFPELVQVEKLLRKKRGLEIIIPCFQRSLDVFANMSSKVYEVLTREKLAEVFNLYGRIEQEYNERKRINTILYSLGDGRLTGITSRAENSLKLCSLRQAKNEEREPPSLLQRQGVSVAEMDLSPCLQKLVTISRVHNFLIQLKMNESSDFRASSWKELVEMARNFEQCPEYGDTVGYLLLLASNYGLRCCGLEKDLIDFVSAAVVRYDSEEPPSFMDNVLHREFARCLSLCYLGELYIKQNHLDDAEATLTRALQAAKQLYPREHPRQIEPLRLLAKLYEHKLEPIYAEGLYRSCLDRLTIPSWALPRDINTLKNSLDFDNVLDTTSVLTIVELRCQLLEDFAMLLEKLEWNEQSRKAEAEHLRNEKHALMEIFPSLGCSDSKMNRFLPGWYCDEALKHVRLL
ncbi:hypothetical protein GpartN1_g5953.t1 [Galdieria partita]|uniref:Uncharacterized protein n=1 Tax=Galdieria partita TaxID=83374 RepID=A0A9C7Q251_9RHOD|nr:hypothetical protein GpartN1_g5953.t1 [Galdieria partita]